FASLAAFVAAPLALVGVLVSRSRKKQGADQAWSTTHAQPNDEARAPNPAHVRRQFEGQVRAQDADFSTVIFEDFLAALYTEAHVARSSQALERYSPYLRQHPRQTLASLGRSVVSSVIVGALRPYHFSTNQAARTHRITMEIESNYTEIGANGQSQAYYACERWTLQRAIGTRSRPPAKARALVCPNCGAPLEKTVHGRCMYCSQAVDSGQFDWVVERIEIVSREERGPMLTGTTEEQGTSSPTVFDSKLRQRHEELMGIDPTFTRENIESRVRWIFSTMQQAWSSLEWTRARPCLTDRLWNAQIYWIEAYRNQGLRNITENARITNIELARVTYDKWYQAITVRIHATGLDYTMVQNNGEVVGGSKSKERPYTEYWTLVRSTARRNNKEGKPACPACGAPLPAEMIDKCRHCGALVESSAFDWVLSRIEQDDVYGG
ncbi:MAG TPA: Tim44-like domain-containing protein, partial [Polyangium sp.]|nr:Tim44-like domain-containing protein [Polyangium sp.]